MSTKKRTKSRKKTGKKRASKTGAKTTVAKTTGAKTAGKATSKKVGPKKAGGKRNPRRLSAVDAAAQVLSKAAKPVGAKELIAAMAEQGLWKSPAGKTPHATLYAAMLREVAAKGGGSRFKKVGRGLFAFNKAGA